MLHLVADVYAEYSRVNFLYEHHVLSKIVSNLIVRRVDVR